MSQASQSETNLATKTAYLLLGWLGIALGLALLGVFDTQNKLPFALLLAVVTPLVLFALDRPVFGGALFDGIRNLPGHSLILWQTDRVMGVAFLVAFAKGALPSGFSLPAGIGDVAIGLAAPWVAANLAMQKPHSKVIARWWNYLGIFDLVLALRQIERPFERPERISPLLEDSGLSL